MITESQLGSAFDPTHLNLFIFPTERCNFRCTYCYEDFEVGLMKPSVRSGIKALLKKRSDHLNSIEISWFGGEPLVGKPVVIELSRYISELAPAYDIKYTANMTTNGYLLDLETATLLIDLGIRYYQISLDGPKTIHDSTRRRADRTGTFDRIWQNLIALRNSILDFRITLRVHFSPDNVSHLHELISSLNHEFGGDNRFNVYFKAVSRLGGSNDSTLKTFSKLEAERIKRILGEQLDGIVNMHLGGSPDSVYICYASKPNSLVIRANGDIAKCTVALNEDYNRIGTISPLGDLDINQGKIRWWMRGFESLNQNELTCPQGAWLGEKARANTVQQPPT